MAKAADKSTLPLNDPRWWPYAQTLQYCRANPLYKFNDSDFLPAIGQGHVRVKIDYLDRSSNPPQPTSRILTPEFSEAALVFWRASAEAKRELQRLRPYVLSFWQPDIEKLWPGR